MYPRIGPLEIFISCMIGLVGIALPVTILVMLFMLLKKLKDIEELLKKD
jgi:hypothetical protein